jgi:hypothetical protein
MLLLLLGVVRVVGRRERAAALLGKHLVAARLGVTREALPEHVGDRGQAVVGLISGHVVDVGCAREVGGLVGDVPGQRVGIMPSGKRLAEGRRLDNPLVGELLVRGSDDAEPWRRTALARQTRRLRCELAFPMIRAFALGRLLL